MWLKSCSRGRRSGRLFRWSTRIFSSAGVRPPVCCVRGNLCRRRSFLRHGRPWSITWIVLAAVYLAIPFGFWLSKVPRSSFQRWLCWVLVHGSYGRDGLTPSGKERYSRVVLRNIGDSPSVDLQRIQAFRRGGRPRPPSRAAHPAHVDFAAPKEGGRGRPRPYAVMPSSRTYGRI
jgi:hypothetical protein